MINSLLSKYSCNIQFPWVEPPKAPKQHFLLVSKACLPCPQVVFQVTPSSKTHFSNFLHFQAFPPPGTGSHLSGSLPSLQPPITTVVSGHFIYPDMPPPPEKISALWLFCPPSRNFRNPTTTCLHVSWEQLPHTPLLKCSPRT